MARDFNINGGTLVSLKFGAHASGTVSGFISTSGVPLGLAVKNVTVTPVPYYRDIVVNDFGPNVPVEVMWLLAEIHISMTLIHYDRNVLDLSVMESMGGAPTGIFASGLRAGRMAPAGTLLGNGRPLYQSGNHFMGLNLASPVLNEPWFFPASYLASPRPAEIPLGVEATAAVLNWRCIPYQYLAISSGTISELTSQNIPLWLRLPMGIGATEQLPLLNPL